MKEVKKWKVIDTDRFCIKAEDTYSEDAMNIPVVVLVNNETGEIKLFSRYSVEKIGYNYALDQLKQTIEAIK